MTAGLQDGQLIGGQADHLDQAVVRSRRLVARRIGRPRSGTSTVAVDVQKEQTVHPELLQLVRHINAVAFQCDVVAQILPFPLQKILGARLTVEELVTKTRAELLRMRLSRFVEL